MLIHFCIVCGYFHVTELGSCNRDHSAHKAEHICYLACYRKGLTTLLFNKDLKVLDLCKLVGVRNYAAYVVVECILGCAPLFV